MKEAWGNKKNDWFVIFRRLLRKTTNPKMPVAATANPIESKSKPLKILVGSRAFNMSMIYKNSQKKSLFNAMWLHNILHQLALD